MTTDQKLDHYFEIPAKEGLALSCAKFHAIGATSALAKHNTSDTMVGKFWI